MTTSSIAFPHLQLILSTDHVTLSFRHPSTSDIYSLSLHDALPIFRHLHGLCGPSVTVRPLSVNLRGDAEEPAALAPDSCAVMRKDRKSTRLNSSHVSISYAVFCLKKKRQYTTFFYHFHF